MYKIEFYVPPSHVESVKAALFSAGAGRVGDYDSCAWQTLGRGQYRPLEGSKPFAGATGNIATIEEFKVEMVCEEKFLQAALAAFKQSHPYEEPAHSVLRLETVE
ncbi:MAG: NGG1p interacting factor NIF3 [Pseudohongiellaceae bacterium]